MPNGAKVVCDNTFMSPYFQRPIDHGVDIVVHSTTKYLNGHSDSVGGFVALNDEKDAEWIGFVQNGIGAILSPFDSFLVLRGHQNTGRPNGGPRQERPRRSRISSPSIRRCRRSIIPALLRIRSTSLQSGSRRASAGWSHLRPARSRTQGRFWKVSNFARWAKALAASRALISHPATMTHASVPAETRNRLGITDGLVRVSVGIEDVEDIIEDLDQALS